MHGNVHNMRIPVSQSFGNAFPNDDVTKTLRKLAFSIVKKVFVIWKKFAYST